MSRAMRLAAIGLISAVGAAACGTGGGGRAKSPATTAASPPVTSGATLPATISVASTSPSTSAASVTTTTAAPDLAAGATRYRYRVGPYDVRPGQNVIEFTDRLAPKPAVDGFITRMKPDIERADGKVPPVDVIHLHHGVWLNMSAKDSTIPGFPERFLAAGEEKTIVSFPPGYGYPTKTSDKWVINYMLHNLLPAADQVWITYEIDVVPSTSPSAAAMKAVRPIWMDVENGSNYPVFDVIKGAAGNGDTYTFPDQATDPYAGGPALNQWVADRDGVLVATAGHLHPGGLHTDLALNRGDQKANLFTSVANYYEPAGAVSWDVSMTATPAPWRVQIRAGDVMSTSATYDSKTASWYESMGIMVAWMADGTDGTDPFNTKVDVVGQVTHGHLAENDHHGGEATALPDPSTLPTAPATPVIGIDDFFYGMGDFGDGLTVVPTVKVGHSITFDNHDSTKYDVGVPHSITACKAPCNRATGIAYPLADAAIAFDSGELGVGGAPTADRTTWATPADLTPGTYTYFCRIHPFMRGAFKVEA